MDKDADGRIAEEEVKEVKTTITLLLDNMLAVVNSHLLYDLISQEKYAVCECKYCITLQIIALSASANKLSKIQDRAEEYAALIMEELDPDNLGYIEVPYIFYNH